jgi:hypothetical protein
MLPKTRFNYKKIGKNPENKKISQNVLIDVQTRSANFP